MRAQNLIIITSGKVDASAGADLARLVNFAQSIKKNVVLVLGPDGDDLLRASDDLDRCEIVFDPNFAGDLFSSVKAGLSAVSGPSFVTVLNEPTSFDVQVWRQLERQSQTNESLIQMAPSENGMDLIDHSQLSLPLFPLLVTAQGLGALKALPAASPWPEVKAMSLLIVPCTTTIASPIEAQQAVNS